jgi:hypothetical protein
LRRTGARRDGPADDALKSRRFMPRRSKGKNVFGGLIAILVVIGFFLQLQWMKAVRQKGAAEIAPNALAEKISLWMLENKEREPTSIVEDTGGAEKIMCEACMGTGTVLSGSGPKEICPICQGVGFHMIRRFDPADRICPACGGMGRLQMPDTGVVDTCPRCAGRGLIRGQAKPAAPPDGD